MPRGVLIATALVAACAPADQEQKKPADAVEPRAEQPAAEQPGDQTRPVSHEELFGQWRLVRMPGVPAEQPLNIHLLIGRYGIEAVSQCIPFRKILPGAVLPESPAPRAGQLAPVVCARALSPIEQSFGPTLAAVSSVERLAEGRVALRGEKGDLVIARNERPVLNPLQNAPGPGPHLMWGEWRVAAIDGSPPPSPMSVLFFHTRLELGSGCVHFGRTMEQQGATLRLSEDPTVTTICERMTSPAEDAAQRILSGTVTIAQSTPRRRLLRGSAGTMILER